MLLSIYGKISSDGGQGTDVGAGGGSGGSVLIQVSAIHGDGIISANGGSSTYSVVSLGGAGSGGRVAIHCETCLEISDASKLARGWFESSVGDFTGSITAHGGDLILNTANIHEYEPILNEQGRSVLETLRISTNNVKAAAAGTVVWQIGKLPTSFGAPRRLEALNSGKAELTATKHQGRERARAQDTSAGYTYTMSEPCKPDPLTCVLTCPTSGNTYNLIDVATVDGQGLQQKYFQQFENSILYAGVV